MSDGGVLVQTITATSPSMQKPSVRRWLILIPVSIGVLFCMAAMYYAGFEKAEFGDAQDYLSAARSFLTGTPYPRPCLTLPMFRPPLFPLAVAGVWSFFPESITAIKIIQALLHGATVFVAYKIVLEIVRKQVPALFGALICSVHPLMIALTLDVYTEPLYAFLCSLAMLLVAKLIMSDDNYAIKGLGAGFFFGLAALTRPSILGVAVCVGIVLPLLYFRNSGRVKHISIAALAIIGGMFLTVAPWTYQNYRDTGELILINDGFGYNLWFGNVPEAIKFYRSDFTSKQDAFEYTTQYWGMAKTKISEFNQSSPFDSLSTNEKEKTWRVEAIRNLTQDGNLTARLLLAKTEAFWTPFLMPFYYSQATVVLVATFVIAIYVFGAYGAYVLAQAGEARKFIVLLLMTFVLTAAIHVLLIVLWRYRVPNVDLYLSMLSGVAVWHLATRTFPRFALLQT